MSVSDQPGLEAVEAAGAGSGRSARLQPAGGVHPRLRRRHRRCCRRGAVPLSHLGGAQPLLLRYLLVPLRRQQLRCAEPVGAVHHPVAGDRRTDRGVPGQDLRARGQGPRCAGGDVCDLSQQRQCARHRGGGEVAGLGHLHRLGRLGGTRRAHHPDRRLVRLDPGADAQPRALAEDHAAGGRRRRRNRCHLRRASGRGAVRHRAAAAGSVQPHLSAGGSGDRHRDHDGADCLRASIRLSSCRWRPCPPIT